MDVEGAGGGAGLEDVGAVDVVGATGVFSADTGIFDGISSSGDGEVTSASLLNPASFPSLVLATDNEVCDDAGEPVCVGVSVVSVTLEDGTDELV